MKNIRKIFNRSITAPLIYGAVTGIAVGCVAALFIICARVVFHFAASVYSLADVPLAAVCAVILAVLCALAVATVQSLCPSSKGSGIPLAEGAARGMLRVKWLSSAAALIAGSLLSFLCGMPLGSEGPCVGVGGLIGEGVGKIAKKPTCFRRYLITAGASAGLATAFNAPLTGLCFAFEETHRRFSPHILASAFACVAAAVLTSQALFFAFGKIEYLAALGIAAGRPVLGILKPEPIADTLEFFKFVGIAAVCGIACAVLGVIFNRGIAAFSRLFGKIRRPFLRMLPVFVTAAAVGLALPLSVGSGEMLIELTVSDAALWLIFTLLAVRLVLTAAASGSGATGGLFVPILAIGGLIGAIAFRACAAAGMDARLAPNIIMLCISAFFAASVRAPITAILLSIELTGGFFNLLPCAIAVGVSTALSDMTRTAPLYERMLEQMQTAAPLSARARSICVTGTVFSGSPVAGERVRNVLWPYNSLVTALDRKGVWLVPDGETVLKEGDSLTVCAENVDPDHFYPLIKEYISVAAPPTEALPDRYSATAHNN